MADSKVNSCESGDVSSAPVFCCPAKMFSDYETCTQGPTRSHYSTAFHRVYTPALAEKQRQGWWKITSTYCTKLRWDQKTRWCLLEKKPPHALWSCYSSQQTFQSFHPVSWTHFLQWNSSSALAPTSLLYCWPPWKATCSASSSSSRAGGCVGAVPATVVSVACSSGQLPPSSSREEGSRSQQPNTRTGYLSDQPEPLQSLGGEGQGEAFTGFIPFWSTSFSSEWNDVLKCWGILPLNRFKLLT